MGTSACHRMIEKLENKIKELEKVHDQINDIYCSGAVEGYTPESLKSNNCPFNRSCSERYGT